MHTSTHQDIILTDRGGIVENRHTVHAAIVSTTGKLLFGVGDPSRVTLARSAAKPAQALAIIESGGFSQFGFDDADLALMCASHNSEERHIARTRDMLSKAQVCDSDLRCGGHPALSEPVNRSWIKSDFSPTGMYNNCSGKHVGMLAGSKALGAGIADYHLADHPMQVKVKRVFEEVCGLDPDDVVWGIDGCNLPAPAVDLKSLGRVYASLAGAADQVERESTSTTRCRNLARIFHAMTRYPGLVAGEDRFCTLFMEAFDGAVVGKLGADGCYCIGVRASEQTKRLGTDGAIGIAVKVEDGSIPILYSAVMEILEQLQIGTQATHQALRKFHYPTLMNTAKVVTGNVSPAFTVRSMS